MQQPDNVHPAAGSLRALVRWDTMICSRFLLDRQRSNAVCTVEAARRADLAQYRREAPTRGRKERMVVGLR